MTGCTYIHWARIDAQKDLPFSVEFPDRGGFEEEAEYRAFLENEVGPYSGYYTFWTNWTTNANDPWWHFRFDVEKTAIHFKLRFA